LDLGHAALMLDVRRVARVVTDRYLKSDTVLTWSMLREIEEETLCDISLLGRWPVEDLMELAARSQIPPNEGYISPEWARRLTSLPGFVYGLFEQRHASSRNAAIAEI
jgi:hypothetical protein